MRVALITGAARGIGLACAQRLADDGHRVLIADRAGADQAAAAIRGARAYTVDLSEPEQVTSLARDVLSEHGHCDVLVNNAAFMTMRTLEELDLETWRRFAAVNIEAPLMLCRELIPAMAAAGGGRVVTVVSNTFWAPPGPGMVPYITSKGALVGMMRSLAVEWGPRGVRVNMVAPGLTRTPATLADMPQEAFDQVRSQQALDLTLEPQDIAGAVAFLVSESAAAVTGQTIRVDAGRVTL